MIEQNVRRIMDELPNGVDLVAAAKGRTAGEIQKAIDAGVKIIGENYIREAKNVHSVLGDRVKWHFIGIPSRQKHDLKRQKVLEIFDMIETIDSLALAEELDRSCNKIGKIMPILIEINSGREPQKSGVIPEATEDLIRKIANLNNIKIRGLMTMGPRFGNPEDSRPFFVETRKIFEQIRNLDIPNVEMKLLSMGMTNSYHIALEEGANIVRIGTRIFEG
jgi:pyridoxal phosphate enzyme (YggS family)